MDVQLFEKANRLLMWPAQAIAFECESSTIAFHDVKLALRTTFSNTS